MAKARSSSSAKSKAWAATLEDLKHLVLVGGIVGAVLATLILGAVLRVDAREEDRVELSAADVAEPGWGTPTAEPPAGSLPQDSPEPTAPAQLTEQPAETPRPTVESPSPDAVARRAMDDSRRLASAGGSWTLQFMVTCKAESARGILSSLAGDERLYLLPLMHDGQPCFRICWDSFDDRDAAVSVRGLPAALLELNADPIPRLTSDLI